MCKLSNKLRVQAINFMLYNRYCKEEGKQASNTRVLAEYIKARLL